MPYDGQPAVFVLLADMHFGSELSGETRIPAFDYAKRWNLFGFGDSVHSYFARRCAGHDIGVIKVLPHYLRQLYQGLRDEGFRRDSFDLLLLLGDQATWPDPAAYRLLQDYLLREQVSTTHGTLKVSCRGLEFRKNQIVMVPGNHDKMLCKDLSIYRDSFVGQIHQTPYPDTRRSHFQSKFINGSYFLFIIVDASVYAEEDRLIGAKAKSHLARGAVGARLRDEIRNKMATLRAGHDVDDAVAAASNGMKFLIIHYGPDVPRVAGRLASAGYILPHHCDGLDRLLDEWKGEFRLVIHGHLHRPKLYQSQGMSVISVGSACQAGEQNGFYVLTIVSADEINAQYHSWAGTGFVPDANFSGSV